MYIVIIQPKGGLNLMTQYVGPFHTQREADDALCNMPVARDCECKFVQQLQSTFWREEWEAATQAVIQFAEEDRNAQH